MLPKIQIIESKGKRGECCYFATPGDRTHDHSVYCGCTTYTSNNQLQQNASHFHEVNFLFYNESKFTYIAVHVADMRALYTSRSTAGT